MNPDSAIIERARRVRLMLFDVDGIMTDGTIYIGQDGEAMKGFNVRDGLGLKLLAQAGVEVGLLSARRSGIVDARAAELGIELVRQGEGDKRSAYAILLAERGLDWPESGYMGDDLPDLPVLTRCGFAASVPQACDAVKSRVHYVSAARAGSGAVREVCDLIVAAKGLLESAVARYAR